MAWWEVFARNNGIGVAAMAIPAPSVQRSKDDEPTQRLQEWQRQAWRYFVSLGEIHYAGEFYARMLSGVRLLVEEFGPPPPDPAAEAGAPPDPDEWQESTNADLAAVLAGLENARGGLAQLQADYGRLRFVQGEAQLVRTLLPEEDATSGEVLTDSDGQKYVEWWEMLSVEELAYSKSEKAYKRRRGGQHGSSESFPETNPDDPKVGTVMAWRFYHRDPQHSGLADSSMRAVLDDCEELLLLKNAIRNTARNRGAGNGVLILPERMGGELVDQTDGTKIPKNAKAIYDALIMPIKNEKAPSAVTPVILFAPNGTTSSEAFHIDLRGAALYRETGLRDECIRRISTGLDLPPEELTGMAPSNHWTAWQIDDSKWSVHGAPVTRELVGQLTSALLAPVARELGLDPRKFRIWFDATEVVQDPDRAKAASEAFDKKAISYKAYRRETGWDETDAPTPQELEERRLADKKSGVPPVTEGAPPPELPATAPPQQQAGIVIGMAEACVLRCRELAGSRLRTRVQGQVAKGAAGPNLSARMQGSPNHDVAWRLGEDVRPGADADSLVAGAGQVFLAGMVRMGLEASLAETLVRRVEEHAALTLFDEEPGPLPDEVLAVCSLVSRRA